MGSLKDYSKIKIDHHNPLFLQKLEIKNVVVASKNLFSHYDTSNYETKTYENNSKSIEFFRNVGTMYRSDLEEDFNAKQCEISEHSGYKSMNDLVPEANLIADKAENLFLSKSHCNIK